MNAKTFLAWICVAALIGGMPASAKDKHGKGPRKGMKEQGRERDRREGQRTFSEEERGIIHGYVEKYGQQEGKHPRGLPPGLAKKVARGGRLPPGWEKKCVPGQPMPADVYQECRPLPRDLAVTLPLPAPGTVTVAVGGKVVRLLEATREILDVFDVHVPFLRP